MLSITDNMGKKSLVALMAVSALVPVMSVQVSASTPNAESDFEFSNGVITKYVGTSKDVVIPSSIGGVTVTEIGSRAFSNNELSSVEIPNSVTVIGNSAFSANNLTSVEIPNSVTSIGDRAFQNNNLTSVEIPDSVSIVGTYAFGGNPLEELHIGKNAKFEGAVFNWTSSSGNSNNGQKFETITVDPDNPNFTFKDGILYNKEKTIVWNATKGWNKSGLNGVEEIKDYAFLNSGVEGKLDIPDTVTEIGIEAFSFNNLTTVDIPNSVTEIGVSAFSFNDLTSVEIPNSVTVIGNEAFRNNNLTSVEIPNSVTEIGEQSFYQNNLTSVVIPDSVTEIGYWAFRNNKLTSVKIPNSVTVIGSSAFSYNELTSVDIPNSVTEIGSQTFYNNPLEKVTIPETVTSIGSNAFKPISPLTTADVPIYGFTGSQAETYATTNGHPFNPSDDIESTQEATLNLFGGTLSLDAPLFESFGTVELTSDVQVVNSSFLDSFKVYDARGTGEGWRLDVTSTQMEIVEPEEGFEDGTSTHVLPVGTLSLDPLESIKPFNDSNGILPTPILETTTLIDDGAVTIAKADVGEGMGAFELTFGEGAFSATIDPSTAKIDKINYPDSDTPYEATVTWTLVSAP